MTCSHKQPGDDCLYLAHRPGSSQFLEHAQTLGITLPDTLPLLMLAARGWLRPRLRIVLPPAAISACGNSRCDPIGSADHDPAHAWAHQLVAQCSTSSPPVLPTDAPWKHWLESQPGRDVMEHAIDVDPTSCPAPIPNPLAPDLTIVPVIDFYAEWQVYHLAELLDRAALRQFVVTGEGAACTDACHRHADSFERHARHAAERWRVLGDVFDRLARFRTLWATHRAQVDDFEQLMERDTRAWAAEAGFDAATVNGEIRDVLLELWADWRERPPLGDHELRRALQRDIGLATHMLHCLTGTPTDPFHPDWFWLDWEQPGWCAARLIDALPNEEWQAPIAFTQNASMRTVAHPPPFARSKSELWTLVRNHWASCAPLRRFCLAWTRLMRDRLHDPHRHAEQTIAANERIEQFNLVGLHTERVLRHVADALATTATAKQEGSNDVMRDAAQRSLTHLARPVAMTDDQINRLIKAHTKLHSMTSLAQKLCTPTMIASGDDSTDQMIAAHLNALIARNYAAHHDKFDDEMIHGTSNATKPHAGATLLSSCLLVVIAALHSLAACKSPGAP